MLGEGTLWVKNINSIFFVDIKKKIILIFNNKTKKKKVLKVDKQIGFISFIKKNFYVLGLKSEIRIVNLNSNKIRLSVNNPNSGDGMEIVECKFNSNDLNISFNSRYLIDIASQVEDNKMIFKFNEPGSPVLIIDPSDKNSMFVVMPMKI